MTATATASRIEPGVAAAAARLRAAGEPYLVATVVRITGSAYRRPGARLVLARDRRAAGSVSGGCLERDLARTAWWRAEAGAPVVVRYDARVPDDADDDDVCSAFGVGCDGVVEVLVEPAPAAGAIDPIGFAAACVRDERRAAIATVFASRDPRVAVGARRAQAAGDGVIGDALPAAVAAAEIDRALAAAIDDGASSQLATGELDVLVEAFVPPPRLFVFGGGDDAVPVVELARGLGWPVVAWTPRRGAVARLAGAAELVTDPPEQLAARVDRCERAIAVVMNHDYVLDRRCVAALLASRAGYIGVLGPRARTLRMLGELGRAEIDSRAPGAARGNAQRCGDTIDARLHAPVGLDLGAETPQEVALAIVAEVQAVVAGAGAASLRDRSGPIHDRADLAHESAA